jgi:hypothetical protein
MDGNVMVVLAVSIVGLILLVVGALLRRHAQPPIPVVQRPVLTDAEVVFHRKLAQAVDRIGGHQLHAQMAMSAFLQPRPGLERGEHLATFRRFSQKRPDFVLVDPSWRVRLIVELDDSSHDAAKDAERDRLTAAAGIPTARFANARKITVDEIHRRLQEALRG